MNEFPVIPDDVSALMIAAERKIRAVLIALDEELEPKGEQIEVDSIHVDTRNFANMKVEIYIRGCRGERTR